MVARQLVFYRWTSVDAKPRFVPHEYIDELAKNITDDPDCPVIENDDVVTAMTVLAPGSPTEPAQAQLLALRNAAGRPSQWRPGGPLAPLPLRDDQYPVDATHVMIWPEGIAAQDLHRNAARLGRLSYYLRQQIGAYVSVEPPIPA